MKLVALGDEFELVGLYRRYGSVAVMLRLLLMSMG